jgi:hypothetical protein
MSYAAHIEHDTVTQVIVGNAAWAVEHLGGQWVDSPTKVGIGWTYTHDDGFRPPTPYPSWLWDDGWHPPVPQPDEGSWAWDEDAGQWVASPQPDDLPD